MLRFASLRVKQLISLSLLFYSSFYIFILFPFLFLIILSVSFIDCLTFFLVVSVSFPKLLVIHSFVICGVQVLTNFELQSDTLLVFGVVNRTGIMQKGVYVMLR